MHKKMIVSMLLTISFIDGSELQHKAAAFQQMRNNNSSRFEGSHGNPSVMMPRAESIYEYIALIGEAYVAYMMGSERFDYDEEFKQYKKDHPLEITEIERKNFQNYEDNRIKAAMRNNNSSRFEGSHGNPSVMMPRAESIDEYIALIGEEYREAYVAYMMGSERFDYDEEFKQYEKDHPLEIAEIKRKVKILLNLKN